MAAGKSERCYPLTLTRPKPLLQLAGKTLLEHSLDGRVSGHSLADQPLAHRGSNNELLHAAVTCPVVSCVPSERPV